jgi:hypothetical protein
LFVEHCKEKKKDILMEFKGNYKNSIKKALARPMKRINFKEMLYYI